MRFFFASSFALLLASPVAAWTEFNEKDRITGVETVGISRKAQETILRPQRRAEQRAPVAVLLFRCEAGKPAVIYFVPDWLTAGRNKNLVQYRFDKDKPVSSAGWIASEDSTGIGLWSKGQVLSFLKSSANKRTLLFRTQNPIFGETESSFDVSDLSEYYGKFLTSCKLKL
ncbi:MAG: hypothetical protein LCH38_14635 [Proteobacteria bacterium]|nr:hypothetical protein [Pseudomonadota bacterium]